MGLKSLRSKLAYKHARALGRAPTHVLYSIAWRQQDCSARGFLVYLFQFRNKKSRVVL